MSETLETIETLETKIGIAVAYPHRRLLAANFRNPNRRCSSSI